MKDTLCIKDVNKYYGNFQALNNINLKIDEGEFVAILGESGSGKSTLLNVISGLDKLDSGEITINGITTRDFSQKEWAIYRNHYVGFIFQEYNLIDHLSVVENVELPLLLQGENASEARKKAIEKCKLLGLGNHTHKLPKKISGGQQQRTAIARALVTEPKVILADEPTGALDSENATIILDILKVLSKDHIVLLVTHDEEFAQKYATRIVTLEDGEIISDSQFKEMNYENTSNLDLKRPNMKLKVSWKFARNNLKKRVIRTLFTSLTMSFGLIAIFLIMFLVNGIRTEVTDIIEKIIPKDQYYVKSEIKSAEITNEEVLTVQDQSIVSEAFFQTSLRPLVNVPISDENSYYPVENYTLNSIPTLEKNFYYRRNLIGNYPKHENEIIITSELAEQILGFSINEKDLKKALFHIQSKNKNLLVERISTDSTINESFSIVGIVYSNQRIAYVLHTKIDKLKEDISEDDINLYYGYSLENKTSLTVYLNTDDNKKIDHLDELLRNNGLVLSNPVKMIYRSINNFFDTVLYILLGTASVSLVVSGILVGLMIYISVIERIKEIGILTSLGARRSNIRHLFIFESAFIGFLSSLIAGAFSVLITLIINEIFNRTIGSLFRLFKVEIFDTFKLLHINVLSIVIVFGISIIYSILCGLIPAYLASRLNAVEALRRE
ncbi:ATP-binding cassette domain-containing protein [Mycoplasmatota bacterium]|nr:ATP-binding cassette domain-containing protein [Mycoplasmatota bacterium]